MQRAAAPTPLIDAAGLEDLKNQIAQKTQMTLDLQTANLSLTDEYTRLLGKNGNELEDSRRQIRELKEANISLTTKHAKEMNAKERSLLDILDNLKTEKETSSITTQHLEDARNKNTQLHAFNDKLQTDNNLLQVDYDKNMQLQADNEKLQNELQGMHIKILDQKETMYGQLNSLKEASLAAEELLHARLKEALEKERIALEKERVAASGLNQVTVRMEVVNIAAHAVVNKCLKHWIDHQTANAFEAWHENAKELGLRRQVVQKVLGHWLHKSMAHAFDNWTAHATQQKKYRFIGQRVVKHWTHRSLWDKFESWHIHVKLQKKAKSVADKVLRRFAHLPLARAFESYRWHVQEQKRYRNVVNRIVLHWTHAGLSAAFESWHSHAQAQHHMENVCSKLISRWVNQTMWHGFESWHENATAQRHMQNVCGKLISRWVNQAMWHAFESWHVNAKEQRRAQEVCTRVVLRMLKLRLAGAFLTWNSRATEIRMQENVLGKVMGHWMNKTMAGAFESWNDHASKGKRYARVMQKVVFRWTHQRLSLSFDMWNLHAVEQRRIEDVCSKMLTRWMIGKAYSAFKTWRINVQKLVDHSQFLAGCEIEFPNKEDIAHFGRAQSCSGLSEYGNSRLMYQLEIRWLQLVDEYYALAFESIFHNGRAITWAEFSERSAQHASAPFLLFDHKAAAPVIGDFAAHMRHRKAIPFQAHWLQQAKQQTGLYKSMQIEAKRATNDRSIAASPPNAPRSYAGSPHNKGVSAHAAAPAQVLRKLPNMHHKKEHFVSRLDQGPSLFGSVLAGVVETARVKKSDPTAWIREMEKRNIELEAYTQSLELHNDELLLRTISLDATPATAANFSYTMCMADWNSGSARNIASPPKRPDTARGGRGEANFLDNLSTNLSSSVGTSISQHSNKTQSPVASPVGWEGRRAGNAGAPPALTALRPGGGGGRGGGGSDRFFHF